LREFIYSYLMTLLGAENYAGLNDNDYGVVNSIHRVGNIIGLT